MHIYRPFFYVIQHIHTGINYAGYKANSKPFMVEGGYCTSSKIIKKIIKEEGLGVFKVRRIKYFNIRSEAHSYEVRFLKRVNAKDNPLFYNQTNDGKDWGMLGKKHEIETKLKMSLAALNKPKSESHKQAMRKPKMSEHRLNLAKANLGKIRSDQSKQKAKDSMKSRGMQWWNNGIQNMRVSECPSIEWKRGRLSWKK